MTERDLGSSFSWWIGEVVDVYDPDQSGRVRVRVYGRHDDKTNIKDEDLPWALPMQPVTSAALGKVGTSPLGLMKGSKVKGYWADKDQQYPIIFGSFGKAGDIKNSGTTTNGTEEIDISTGSIPSASTNQSDPVDINPYSKLYPDRKTINDINQGKAEVDKTTRTEGVVNKTAVDSKLKQPTKPTTASADKTNKADVLEIIKNVDPSKSSASIKNVVDNYSAVRNIINVNSIVSQAGMLSGGLSGAISGLAGQFGLSNMLPALSLVAKSGLLGKTASNALYSSLTDMTVAAITNNGNISQLNPISTIIPQINPLLPRPSNIVQFPGATYAQQYYAIDREPYPGYIEWRDPVTNIVSYTLRGNEPYYASAQDHIMAKSALQLGSTLSTIFKGGVPSIPAIAGAITGGLNLVQGLGVASILGNGVSLDNIAGLASHFLPGIAGNIGSALENHLPKSVLGAGVQNTMNEFTKNQAMLAIKKSNMKTALNRDFAGEFNAIENLIPNIGKVPLAQ